jgi:hypothetical protein
MLENGISKNQIIIKDRRFLKSVGRNNKYRKYFFKKFIVNILNSSKIKLHIFYAKYLFFDFLRPYICVIKTQNDLPQPFRPS